MCKKFVLFFFFFCVILFYFFVVFREYIDSLLFYFYFPFLICSTIRIDDNPHGFDICWTYLFVCFIYFKVVGIAGAGIVQKHQMKNGAVGFEKGFSFFFYNFYFIYLDSCSYHSNRTNAFIENGGSFVQLPNSGLDSKMESRSLLHNKVATSYFFGPGDLVAVEV
jgi:hypothetical protein